MMRQTRGFFGTAGSAGFARRESAAYSATSDKSLHAKKTELTILQLRDEDRNQRAFMISLLLAVVGGYGFAQIGGTTTSRTDTFS